MVPAAIIATKRDGGAHSADEIESMIEGFVQEKVADYQMAAWAMAIVCRGMTSVETAALTAAMLASGTRLPRATDRPRVDKHSTGGLGDSPSIIMAPLLACFDLDVPMLSGRGLGITGGTLDKLEAFPGFRTNLTSQEISRQLESIGCVVTGTTADIAPADRRLYALRDVTGTVESVALITASIMSKKLAETLDALVLDVKHGSGAFMQKSSHARELASSLVAIGQQSNLQTRVLLTDMNQPLGRMVGNACEINEAIEILKGEGLTGRLAQVTLQLSSELLVLTGKANGPLDATTALKKEIASGRPLERLKQMIESQGGRFQDQLPTAAQRPLLAPSDGFIATIDGRCIGTAIIEIGGGRKIAGAPIDHSVGIEMCVELGDRVTAGQPLVHLFSPSGSGLDIASALALQSFTISREPPTVPPLFSTL